MYYTDLLLSMEKSECVVVYGRVGFFLLLDSTDAKSAAHGDTGRKWELLQKKRTTFVPNLIERRWITVAVVSTARDALSSPST